MSFKPTAEQCGSFEAWKSAVAKMLAWKQRRSPATVQRLEAEQLAQIQASAKITIGGV